ncbi:serine hydrolase domain-containing protein [Elioraea sp.]|uniref:serine hydrolase domain-containing protein n=1 Tax=Elioraea sp. TaxID=2185103 RepID=UPI003F6FE981
MRTISRRAAALGLGGLAVPRPADARRLDPALLERALETAASLDPLHSLVVARDREIIVERRFAGPPLDRPANIKSVSKAVVAALVGIAIARGVFTGPDQPIAPLLADHLPRQPDPRLHAITIDHLLSMRAGLERTSGANYGRWVTSGNWVRHVLARPFIADPGGPMLYSTGNSHLLSALLTRATGRSTLALARGWLGAPLGIDIPPWPRDPQGIYFGGNDMLLVPRDLLRFAELHRLGGTIDGTRVLPEQWIRECWTPRTASRFTGAPHGYAWFLAEAGGHRRHYAWGFGGQMVHVVPSLGLSVVMTSDPTQRSGGAIGHARDLHRLMDGLLIPSAASAG